ncbi:von Willebrand factor A domain-containing protein 8 [Phytophthora pseudosyringae]|uniref:von Willebrand factor A domain-containing protein 8 n=1 Tax=Phytophthora pseudosyringae TaxID=221518 RepID=A0A8T1V351_9STRA|nr:von Willebrand factor A domain-containing protein 8 [Phytophthora pseudosyringae]
MATSSLYPPNYQLLSDKTIGSVVQRAKVPANRSAPGDHVSEICLSYLNWIRAPPMSAMLSQSTSDQRTGHNHVLPPTVTEDATKTSTRSVEAMHELDGADPFSVVARLAHEVHNHKRNLAGHSERRRKYQVRYRTKQRELTATLEKDVWQLESEIQELRVRRHTSVPTQQTLWTITTEYFRLFRHGFRSPPQALQSITLKFLRASMAPDVVSDCQCGPEAIMAKWRLFSEYFDDVHVELESLGKATSAHSLVGTTTTSVTITEETMRAVFPHLNCDGKGGADGGQWSSLGHKLLNQRLVMPGSVCFDWGSAAKSVVRIHSQSDMLTPMLHLVGSLEDVSLVFAGARVTPDCRLTTLQ